MSPTATHSKMIYKWKIYMFSNSPYASCLMNWFAYLGTHLSSPYPRHLAALWNLVIMHGWLLLDTMRLLSQRACGWLAWLIILPVSKDWLHAALSINVGVCLDEFRGYWLGLSSPLVQWAMAFWGVDFRRWSACECAYTVPATLLFVVACTLVRMGVFFFKMPWIIHLWTQGSE